MATKEKIVEVTQGLPSWAKGVIAVVAVGGVVFIGYKVYKLLQDITQGKDQRDVVQSVKQEIKNELSQGAKPTHPMSVYRSAVNQIKNLLDNCEFDMVNELDVIRLLTKVVKNNLDWKILQQEWGVKDVEDCMSMGTTKYELAELLQEQLDQTLGDDGYVFGENFAYEESKSGKRKSIDILKIYFNKIGVKF